jgi:hypothetical protein
MGYYVAIDVKFSSNHSTASQATIEIEHADSNCRQQYIYVYIYIYICLRPKCHY